MQKQVTLDVGQSERVTFVVTPNTPDIYQATVDGLSNSFEAKAVPGVGARLLDIRPVIQYFSGCNFLKMNFTMECAGQVTVGVKGVGWSSPVAYHVPFYGAETKATYPAGIHSLYIRDYANTCDALNEEGWHTVTIGIELWEWPGAYQPLTTIYFIFL